MQPAKSARQLEDDSGKSLSTNNCEQNDLTVNDALWSAVGGADQAGIGTFSAMAQKANPGGIHA